MVPPWLLRELQQKLAGGFTFGAADLALYTRAIMPSPEAVVDPAPTEVSLEWLKPPLIGIANGTTYADGPPYTQSGNLRVAVLVKYRP